MYGSKNIEYIMKIYFTKRIIIYYDMSLSLTIEKDILFPMVSPS